MSLAGLTARSSRLLCQVVPEGMLKKLQEDTNVFSRKSKDIEDQFLGESHLR